MQSIQSILTYPKPSKAELKQNLMHCTRLIKEDIKAFSGFFKHSHSENAFYERSENIGWTTGFWTGQIWLAYEMTGEKEFLDTALAQVESFYERILQKIDVNHHDMGFLYSLSCMPAIKLLGDETAKEALLLAAENLMLRFREKGEFIQAWGELDAPDNYRLIIDCLLNIPLLYRATELSGDMKYEEYGKRHVKTAMEHIIREDYSTYHTYYFDLSSGLPLRGATHQGNRDESAWSRGQAWGIYGTALSFAKLRDMKYLDIFEKLTSFFITHLPDDLIPYWDFDFDTGSREPRDSSSLAIAICGILEMCKYLDAKKAELYHDIALRLLKALAEHCMVSSKDESNGLLLHGTYCKSTPTNTCPNMGVDECVIWGDYFYMEALTRSIKEWDSYW